jgi:hypothetical protein
MTPSRRAAAPLAQGEGRDAATLAGRVPVARDAGAGYFFT